MQHRVTLTIHSEHLATNYRTVREIVQPCEVMPVLKANAYGHGDVEVATTLQKIGVCDFAVSNIDEGIKLRENGITGNLLILGYTPINRLFEVKRYNLSQTIISSDYLVDVLKTGLNISVQFKIETGMNRLGLPPNKAKEVALCQNRRAIILETQSCNTNAIGFYLHQGFELIGFDTCCYTNNDIGRREVRINLGYFFHREGRRR